MKPEELFEEKQHLVMAAIKQVFGSYAKAKRVAESNNMELDDLIQIGQVKLWELCLKYDPEMSGAFNTYVMKSVKWKIINELHEKGRLIKVSKHYSHEEREKFQFHSIDLHKDGQEESEYFAVSSVNVEEEVVTSIQLEEAMSVLGPEEKLILTKKSYGFSDDEIAIEIGKSRHAVNKRKNRAYLKINPNYKRINKSELIRLKKQENHLRQQVI